MNGQQVELILLRSFTSSLNMGSPPLVFLLSALAAVTVKCNSEVDVLFAWRNELVDPNNVLQSWDATLPSPCTWLHITCDSENRVTRVDLGKAGLEGRIAPYLGNLTNLQYLELFGNNISGSIPREIGKLSHLVSLGLWSNKLSGKIPGTLGNLKSLRFLRLNSNKLTGKLPIEVIQLIQWGNLDIMNVSDNRLDRSVYQHSTNKTGFAVTTIIQDAKAYM